MEEIVQALWSLFEHGSVAAYKLSDRLPLPPGLSAKDLPEEQTEVLYVHRMSRIDCHPVESDEDSAPESISDTGNWLNSTGVFDNPNDSEEYC